MTDDRRLIEDYLPIEAISAEASREKSVRKGHISTLHLWWARRPLVACRAAVYGALVPASQFVPNGGTDAQKKSLGRANAAKFVKSLCQYPGSISTIKQAQEHILKAHAERLTKELADAKATGARPAWAQEFKFMGERVTVEDIQAGRAPRPRVLDMFAGGGAIPLEALRLGCEAYALDLNPVAHIIQLCTLVYPQKFGKPDPNVRGMTGPKNAKGETTWGGLAEEVRYWGNWVLEKVRSEIGDLYPPIPDPEFRPRTDANGREWFDEPQQTMAFAADAQLTLGSSGKSESRYPKSRPGYLTPVAYLWTRTVTCKNPHCRAIVPLVRQTWLCKKPGRYVALKMVAGDGRKEAQKAQEDENSFAPSAPFRGQQKRVRFEVVEADTADGLGFDPEAFSKGGNATCPFCGTVADSDYVKAEACAKRMGQQMMAVAAACSGKQGKIYLSADSIDSLQLDVAQIQTRLRAFSHKTGLQRPDEPMDTKDPTTVAGRGFGIRAWHELFTERQTLSLLTFVHGVHLARQELRACGLPPEHGKAIATVLAVMVDKLADFCSTGSIWNYTGGRGVKNTFARQALPMTWDFCETNPFNPAGASWIAITEDIPAALDNLAFPAARQDVRRGSAAALPWEATLVDAVVTDPPYYDNISYAVLSDFFYVWLKRSIGDLYAEHFGSLVTPKKAEAISDSVRHGNQDNGRAHYEQTMAKAFAEANRVLKQNGELVVVYAHKTTLGWVSLVESLRQAGFVVIEAWPLDTEKTGRIIAQDAAALASSIFLVARKRQSAAVGNYEDQVRPELEQIVRERVETLWEMGISGADLVIACVGAGLRAFTQFARVEYANGEEAPAERFLTEVETVVLETILARLSKEVTANARESTRTRATKDSEIRVHSGSFAAPSLAGLDAPSRFYILWRYTYGAAELEAGEAIVFANGTHVELDGPQGLASGSNPVLQKNKSKYRLLDYTARGGEPRLGLPTDTGEPVPMIDALHRLLWLLEHRPLEIPEFLADARPSLEQLRLVSQALAGPALKGSELKDISPTAEQSALGKLLANWQSVVEGKEVVADRQRGQERFL